MSSFTTDYPSGEARVTNIHRGADLLNNTVVEPGKVFSLNDTIGPRTAARGFVTAPVFAAGEFFDDYGGGVSQLATTTYNAAFFAGYADVTHQPHTIYISRYPPGREATVNYGVIDLQFRDDSPHGVLDPHVLQRHVDHRRALRRHRRTNRARGEPRRRRTRSRSPTRRSNAPHRRPSTRTTCARRWPPGETEQVSTGDAGFDVAFDRVIDQPGQPRAPRALHVALHDAAESVPRRERSRRATTAPVTNTSTPLATAPPTTPSTAPSGPKPDDADHPSHQHKRRPISGFLRAR